ncbi:MAG: hypothetical protein F4Y26_02835 [Gammaproteobacteria bacterium]|nr:hypothetical protein [Gammaproteobacteria bacterium]
MAVGNASAWTARLRTLDERFLERVVALWPRCRDVLPDSPAEDTITENVVAVLSKDAQSRRLFHHVEYHYEPFGYTPEGFAFSKGEIDMAVLLDQERDRYLAYECKRLNVPRKGGTRSLATEYVRCGVRRFVTEKYAADLPVGCMLGYVLDGDTSTARTKVLAALEAPKNNAALLGKPRPERPIGAVHRFSSDHARHPSGQQIEIRHALLPL